MIRLALALAAASFTACVAGSTPVADQPGSLSGVVDYLGDEAGPLRVVAYPSFPPVGAPAAKVTITEPHFPQPYTLSGLPPGRYFVLAIVDTFADDGDRYRPRVDPGGTYGRYDSPRAVTLDGDRAALDVDIELIAPAPGSPWDR